MDKQIQTISNTGISAKTRKIDSIEFDGGDIEKAKDQHPGATGSFTVTNNIIGKTTSDDGSPIVHLRVRVKISPDPDTTGYALKMSVSGLYKAESHLAEQEVEKLVLTAGSTDLYSYAKDKISEITQDGLFGVPELPILLFRFDENR